MPGDECQSTRLAGLPQPSRQHPFRKGFLQIVNQAALGEQVLRLSPSQKLVQ